MDFEDWFEELLQLAYDRSDNVGFHVQRAFYMYEDYHAEGLSPLDALEAEWGEG